MNANGVRVEVHTDKSVDAYTRGAVKVHSPANDSAAAKPASKIGDEMTDGTGIAINGLAGYRSWTTARSSGCVKNTRHTPAPSCGGQNPVW